MRFLPEPKTPEERKKWWLALLAAGPGWSIIGVVKMLAGSYLVTLAIRENVPRAEASDPTRMYHAVFDQVLGSPVLVLGLTLLFVVLSQLKINVTNAYAGSIAWSNFFSRLTQSHPGRVVWLVFNVAIALMLMELGVFTGLEHVLSLYSLVAVAWIGALVADLVVNKPLGLSPKGIEFRRSHLYDVNPVGLGAMLMACAVSLTAYAGVLGENLQAFSSFLAFGTAFLLAPLIAWGTSGAYYLSRDGEDEGPSTTELQTCTLCAYRFDAEDMTTCPFHAGEICSLCCTLDAACHDMCKPHGRFGHYLKKVVIERLPSPLANALLSRMSRFVILTTLLSTAFAALLLIIRSFAGNDNFDAILTVIFGTILIVIGIVVWMFILVGESQRKAILEGQQQTDLLLKEVRAHERTDRALQIAKDKAESANLAKTRYISGLSHELRTPLNAIYGFSQLLEKDAGLAAWRGHISSIRRSSEHLAGLIEGLLDIARIEAGRLEITRDRVNLRLLLKQLTAIFEEEARRKDIDFRLETHGRLPILVGTDEKRLRQIIINLLSNAIRYTTEGHVVLSVSYRSEVAVITVSDTGIGIPEEQIDRISRPFERAGQRGLQGSGLGLTITKLLVEMLGGEIDVKSTQGKGSVFAAKLMLPSISPSVFDEDAVDHNATKMPFDGYNGPRKTVLVVDDDLNHLALADHFLSNLGFVVLTASSVGVAEQLLEDVAPDIILLDIDMPEKDGWSFAHALREGARPTCPIIMISGHANERELRRQSLSLHDAFIAKPYNLDDLLLEIAEQLKITLELKATDNEQALPYHPLSADDAQSLLDFAFIGHASGIRDKLDTLRADRNCPEPLLGRLETLLGDFDLEGIRREVERAQHDLI